MGRITSLSDTPKDVMIKMAGGNPGAISVMIQMIKQTEDIDPDNALGGLGAILFLDTLGIYEHRIWMLYKDVCKSDMVNMLGALRAVQLGIATDKKLTTAIDGSKSAFDVDAMVSAVKKRLPSFGKKELSP